MNIKSLTFWMIAFIGCNNPDKVEVIDLRSDMQFVNAESNQLFTITDSLTICYCNNYTIYRLPHAYLHFQEKKTNDGSVTMEQTSKSETTYNFVVHNRNNGNAYWLDSLNSKTPRKISIDSFLNIRVFANFPFYKESLDTLLNSRFDSSTKILTETCVPKKRFDDSYPDTIYYNFINDFKNVKFSFSRKLDSLKKMKLFKVEFITNKIPKGNDARDIPKRTFLFEIKKSKFDTTSIMHFVKNFEVMEQQLTNRKKEVKK